MNNNTAFFAVVLTIVLGIVSAIWIGMTISKNETIEMTRMGFVQEWVTSGSGMSTRTDRLWVPVRK